MSDSNVSDPEIAARNIVVRAMSRFIFNVAYLDCDSHDDPDL